MKKPTPTHHTTLLRMVHVASEKHRIQKAKAKQRPPHHHTFPLISK